jgi:hypothetical protein
LLSTWSKFFTNFLTGVALVMRRIRAEKNGQLVLPNPNARRMTHKVESQTLVIRKWPPGSETFAITFSLVSLRTGTASGRRLGQVFDPQRQTDALALSAGKKGNSSSSKISNRRSHFATKQ